MPSSRETAVELVAKIEDRRGVPMVEEERAALVKRAQRAILVRHDMRRGGDHELRHLLGLADVGGESRKKVIRLMVRDGPLCVWCGRNLASGNAATIDHVRAAVAGGKDRIENLVLACRPCNAARGHMPARRWLGKCLDDRRNVQTALVLAAFERTGLREKLRPMVTA